MPSAIFHRCRSCILANALAAALGLGAQLAMAQTAQPNTGAPDTPVALPQSESDRRAEIRRTLDQRPHRVGTGRDDNRSRLSDEERRDLRKDIGDAVRDVYDKNRRKNTSSKRSRDR